jgi:hypothetical protein
MKKLLILCAVLLMAGCAHWVKTEGPYTSDSQSFAVDPPQGWMRSNSDKMFLITRDGTLLQRIVISRIGLSDEKQFNATRKRVTGEMLPQEVAEIVADDIQSEKNITSVTVEETTPATISGKPGFRLQLVYSTKEGLRYRFICYGLVSGKYLYRIMYAAPVRYYFDRDLPAFEKVASSFKLTRP